MQSSETENLFVFLILININQLYQNKTTSHLQLLEI